MTVTLSFDERWTLITYLIRMAFINFGKDKAKERRLPVANITSEISALEYSHLFLKFTEILSKLHSARKCWEELCDYKFQGNVTRARARWVEQGEKNT